MTSARRTDSILLEDLIRSLESTTRQVQELVDDIRDSEKEFIQLKTKVEILSDVVRNIHILMNEGPAHKGLITRVTILEDNFDTFEEEKKESDKQHINLIAVEKTGKWQTVTAIITGSLALIASVITLAFKIFK